MERLTPSQQEALEQLQGILGHHSYDVDVLTSMLQTLDWDVQRATNLLVNGLEETQDIGRNLRDRQMVQVEPEASGHDGYEHSLTRILLSLLYLPFGLVSGMLRFISGIIRVPLLITPFNFSSYRPLRQMYPDSRSATRRWITSLEEETGAMSFNSATVTATGLDDRQLTSRRHTYPPIPDESKILPDFFDGTYEEVLDACQKEGRIACIILVSAEHDDVLEFKRSTLTHPGFVRVLSENDMVVWGGDIRDKDSWDAAQKLQATTYPFVAFIALQPRRNHLSNSSSSSPTPVLTVLSRHHGPPVPESESTSAQSLIHHLQHQLLPRVTPFLTRFKSQLQERERDRIIREQQDKAFQESAERDRERIQARIRAEQEETQRLHMEEIVRHREEQRMELEREKQQRLQELRLHHRRWMRRCIVSTEHQGTNGIRLAFKLPGNTRVVHTFSPGSTLTELYAFVDTQTLPLALQPETDPERVFEGSGSDLQQLEAYISQTDDVVSWWGFKLVLLYPRREIKWTTSVLLEEAGLKSGEQLVVELMKEGFSSSRLDDDDDYESEDD